MSAPKSKKLSFFLKTAFLVLLLSSVLIISKPDAAVSQACPTHTLSGYAWSENIGWISFSTAGAIDYGVDLDDSTKNFSGYAWSENIGWINFGPAADEGYPGAPGHEAMLNTGTNEVDGWARACSVFEVGCSGGLKPEGERGGWDGWISMKGTTPDYNVSFDPDTMEFSGYAWGSDVIGWIKFSGDNYGVVWASGAPTVLQVQTESIYYTNPYNVHTLTPNFKWVPFGTQTGYQIQVATDSGFDIADIVWDTGQVASDFSSDITYSSPTALLDGTVYYWRVKGNSACGWSAWSATAKFKTNTAPTADFSYNRSFVGSDIRFNFVSSSVEPDSEEPFGFVNNPALDGSIASYTWDLNGDDIFGDSTDPTAQKTYTNLTETVAVSLRVTDDGGLVDETTQSISLKFFPQVRTESGDVYSTGDIQGKNFDFSSAFLIHAGGTISNVSGVVDWQKNYDIDFPAGTNRYTNALGRIDWNSLKCSVPGDCTNSYGYEVEDINNPNQIDDTLGGKVYFKDGDLTINSVTTFENGVGSARGNGLIMVDGDLIINNDIRYEAAVANVDNLAAVGWLIKGDLIIDPEVEELAGAFVVLGDGNNSCALLEIIADQEYSIEPHCGLAKTGSDVPNVENDVSLTIRGLLIAKRFFFQRALKTEDPGIYAEEIIYDHQLFLNPPPGMEDFIKGLPIWHKVAP